MRASARTGWWWLRCKTGFHTWTTFGAQVRCLHCPQGWKTIG
jgi:hypothetical protein